MHRLPPINAKFMLKKHYYSNIIVNFPQDTLPLKYPAGSFREKVPKIAAL